MSIPSYVVRSNDRSDAELSMKALIFHQITDAQLENAHTVYLEIFAWLKAKGVRQWLRPISREVFVERHQRGELFALSSDNVLTAIVTVAFEINSYWPEKIGESRRWWIKSLGVARLCHNAGIGRQMMEACERHLRTTGATEVFLDCVDGGFLPAYYARLGYDEISRKDITYPSGNTFPMVLMKKPLAHDSAD